MQPNLYECLLVTSPFPYARLSIQSEVEDGNLLIAGLVASDPLLGLLDVVGDSHGGTIVEREVDCFWLLLFDDAVDLEVLRRLDHLAEKPVKMQDAEKNEVHLLLLVVVVLEPIEGDGVDEHCKEDLRVDEDPGHEPRLDKDGQTIRLEVGEHVLQLLIPHILVSIYPLPDYRKRSENFGYVVIPG